MKFWPRALSVDADEVPRKFPNVPLNDPHVLQVLNIL